MINMTREAFIRQAVEARQKMHELAELFPGCFRPDGRPIVASAHMPTTQKTEAREKTAEDRDAQAEELLRRCLDGFSAYIHGRKMSRQQRDQLRCEIEQFLEGCRVR